MAGLEVEAFAQRQSQWHHLKLSLGELVHAANTASDCLVVFISTADWRKVDVPETQQTLSKAFDIPSWFWSPLYLESNGYFSATDHTTPDKKLEKYSTCFRFLAKHVTSVEARIEKYGSDIFYTWDKLGFCTKYEPSRSPILLCFDIPVAIQGQIRQSLLTEHTRIATTSPFALHSFLLPFIVHNFDQAVWSCRDLIRSLEYSRPQIAEPKVDYERMHEIARHTTHSTEMLGTSLIVLDSMISELQKYKDGMDDTFETSRAKCQTTDLAKYAANRTENAFETRAAQRDLNFHKSTLGCLQLRSKALEERLKSEIYLAFQVGTQHDSLISTRIAEASQRDSLTMKTISILGLIFLPGTLISSIFSMTFFNFSTSATAQSGTPTVSGRFWIYWAVTAPITIAVLVMWLLWQGFIARRVRLRSYDQPVQSAR